MKNPGLIEYKYVITDNNQHPILIWEPISGNRKTSIRDIKEVEIFDEYGKPNPLREEI
jgi:hypothetical protein